MQRFVSFINEKNGGSPTFLGNLKRVTTKKRLGATSLRCLSAWCVFVLDDLWNAIYGTHGVLPTTQFAYRKGLGTCDALLSCPIHCKVHWIVDRRLGSCRLISVQPLIGLTIRAFSIGSCSVGIGGSVLSILTQFLSN